MSDPTLSDDVDDEFKEALICKQAFVIKTFIDDPIDSNFFDRKSFVDQLLKNDWTLQDVIELGQPDLTKLFLDASIANYSFIHIDNDNLYYGCTPLHKAACNFDIVHINLLLDYGANPNSLNHNLRTPLWYAAINGFVNAVEILLKKGSDVNAADANQSTPIYAATRGINIGYPDEEHLECIILLLQHGADVQIVSTRILSTVFDVIKIKMSRQNAVVAVARVVLEHLALENATGISIKDVIQSKINTERTFEEHLDFCKTLLQEKFNESQTLFNLLTCNECMLVPYMRNEMLVKILQSRSEELKSMNVIYYHRLLQTRLTKASETAKLRELAAVVIGKLMDIHYNCHSVVLDIIIIYLDNQDLNTLLSLTL